MSIQAETREKIKTTVKEPKHFRVMMYNDDFTSMEFVVGILTDIFRKPQAEAERLMLLVHQKGKAAVGLYPYDIAATKVQTAAARARQEGFPFRMTVEEAE